MQIIQKPERKDWPELLTRPSDENADVQNAVQDILLDVLENGDEAIRRYALRFDKISLQQFEVTEEEWKAAETEVSPELKEAIGQAKYNIEIFHKTQLKDAEAIQTMPGIQCWRKNVGIDRVGLYVPGGTAPLFSTVLMLGVPAALARCRQVVLCTPCNQEGVVHPAVLFAARLVGIHKVYKIGGAQAIAAMAFGTESVPEVYKIFGPGNQYVTAAKQLVQMHGVSIDMPAGPSEVCVLADETANPAFVAADLLSQAEHGVDSQVLLVSTSEELVQQTLVQLELQLQKLPRKEMARKALENSKAILLGSITEAMELVNEYAAEHLIISCAEAEALAENVTNAGSVFIGNFSPESVGDYASGTNHTLPTNGYAKAYSGVSVDSFLKKITFQKLTREGLGNIGNTVIRMAEAEGLQAHAEAVRVRLKKEN